MVAVLAVLCHAGRGRAVVVSLCLEDPLVLQAFVRLLLNQQTREFGVCLGDYKLCTTE
jgi:hypothetical protein